MPHDLPNQTSDLVAYQSYPQLAAALRTRIPNILRRWEAATRNLLPRAEALNGVDFRDDVPLTLKRMADALASKRPVGLYDLEDTARVHGASRFDQNFKIRDVITEFRLLRRIILEEIHEERGTQFTFGEMVEMSMASDAAFQETILTFVDHQRDQIQAATEAEAKFLSFMSHDLRNHLNHITLSIEGIRRHLQENPAYAEDAADLKSVQDSIFQTLNGMEMLLQSERLRKGAVAINPEVVNLRDLGYHVLQQFRQTAADKNLTLQADIPSEATVHTDRPLLSLVLQNLVGNAAKYTDKGFVKLQAQPWSDEQVRGWTLSVIDSGPGIPPEQFKTLFDAFTRGNAHAQPGLGLGLAIASQATKLLGGSLNVESIPGEGSIFHVKLKSHPPVS